MALDTRIARRFGLAGIAVGLVAAVSLLTGPNAPAASEQAPTPALITGADAGGGARVRGWSETGAGLPGTDFFAYSSYGGAVRVAAGDVDGDGAAEIVTAPGPYGNPPDVHVFDASSHARLRSTTAFGRGWAGGVYVASADLNGDGEAEVIAGADAGGGSDIQVYDGDSGRRLAWFNTTFPGYGARVTAGDVNGDGRAEIIAAPGPGGPPRIEVYAGNGGNPCGCGYGNGIPFRTIPVSGMDFLVVATGDVVGDGRAEIVVGGVTSSGSQVRVLDAASGAALVSFFPYASDFLGSLSVAAGDLDGHSGAEIVTSARTSGGSEIKQFDAEGRPVGSFFSLDPELAPGLSVAVADGDGDGQGEIIAGGGASPGSHHVTTFDPSGRIRSGFVAYEPLFPGGVRVAAGDVGGDAAPEIVTAPGPGRTTEIEIFDLDGDPVSSFLPFGDAFDEGAYVAVGDLDGDRESEVVVGAGEGGEPRVKVLDGFGRELASFLAFEATFEGGVRVAVGDMDGDGKGEIVAGAGPGGSNRVRVIDPRGVLRATFVPFDATATDGVFVAAGDLEGDGRAELVAGTEPGSPAQVRVVDLGAGGARPISVFHGKPPVGAHVATADIDEDGRDEIVVGSGYGADVGMPAQVKVLDAAFGERRAFVPYEGFLGGTFVGAPTRVGAALPTTGTTIRLVEGKRFAGVVATFSDSAGRDSAGDFSASISWGDDRVSSGRVDALGGGAFRVLGRTRFPDVGVYRIVVTISDARGRTVKANGVARVGNASLVANGRSFTVAAGSAFTRVVATARDGNLFETVHDLQAVIRWGDGTRSSGRLVRSGAAAFSIVGRHRFAKPGTYRVVVRVRDADGGEATATTRIRAAD